MQGTSLLYSWLTTCQVFVLPVMAADIQSYNLIDQSLKLREINEKLQLVKNIEQREKRSVWENGVPLDVLAGQDDREQRPDLSKYIHQLRSKRSLAELYKNKADSINWLSEILLARHKRHLSEQERDMVDPFAFQAKDYNYYDYNNMLTAITLPSSTIRFVERCKKENDEVAQGNKVHMFNRMHKNVWGGFHNDSEMLTFLRNYKNYTMEEKKHAFWNDFMIDRCNKHVEFWEKNHENYKKHYRSFREKSNKEGHHYVNPETEDQSFLIPDFEEPAVLNYTSLYRYFRAACDHAEEKSSECEPPPVNHYMPANYTSSPEDQVYRSGEVEAFNSDYENERINTSCFTEPEELEPVSRRRRRRSDSQVLRRIDIKVVDRIYEDNGESFRTKSRNHRIIRHQMKNKKIYGKNGRLAEANDLSLLKEVDHPAKRNLFVEPIENNVKPDANRIQNVNQINIMFQINQNGQNEDEPLNNRNTDVESTQHSRSYIFNALGEVLNLLKYKVNLNVVKNALSNIQIGSSSRQQQKDEHGVLDMIKNILNNFNLNRQDDYHSKSIKEFEIYDVNNDLEKPRPEVLSRSKRSLSERKFLTVSKAVRTVDNNDDFVLHLYLVPTAEAGALGEAHARNLDTHARAKRDVNLLGKDETSGLYSEMKPVFSWKDIADSSVDSSKLKRRRRENSEEVKGYQDPAVAGAGQACKITFKSPEPSIEEEPQGCRITFKPPEPSKEEEPQGCRITFKPPEPSNEEEPQGCPLTFSTHKAAPEETPDLSLDHIIAKEQLGTSSPMDPTFIQESFKEQDAQQELRKSYAGFSEHEDVTWRHWTGQRTASVLIKRYGGYNGRISPYVVSRRYTPTIRRRVTYKTDPVTKLVEPKFIRLIYNGKGYSRHVHYITNREFQTKKYISEIQGVGNLYRENFLLETNETVRSISREKHKVPKMIQNHYADYKSNLSRHINLYYDAEGDLTYSTNADNFRIPVAKQWMPNKYYYRNYYHRTFNKRILTNMKEPILVQLHYKY